MTHSYVPVPARTGLSVAIMLLYGFAGMCMWSRVVIKRNVPAFSLAPLWALVAVRVCEAVFGLVTSIPSSQTQHVKAYFWFMYTFFWDLGLLCIVLALICSLSYVLSWRHLKTKQAILALLLLAPLVIGSSFAGVYTFSSDQAGDAIYNQVSKIMLWIAFAAMTAALVAIAVPFSSVLIRLRRHEDRFSSADLAVCSAFFPTFVLLVIRVVPDILRIFLYRSPDLAVFVGMELVPEMLAVTIWICTAHLVTHWQFKRDKEADELREHKKEVWSRHLDDAISYAQAVRQKGADISHRKKPWILYVAETRMFNGDDATGLVADSSQGRAEAVNLLVRLRSLSGVIADNLVLVPDLRQPLLKKGGQQRAIDMQATEARVAEELPKLFGMPPDRAKKVARDWVIIFVLDWRTLT